MVLIQADRSSLMDSVHIGRGLTRPLTQSDQDAQSIHLVGRTINFEHSASKLQRHSVTTNHYTLINIFINWGNLIFPQLFVQSILTVILLISAPLNL